MKDHGRTMNDESTPASIVIFVKFVIYEANCHWFVYKAKIKYMSVSGNMLKKIRVGRSEKYFILFFHFILKWCKMQKLMWSLSDL